MTRIYSSAKTLIATHGLDPEKIEGTGTGGAITKKDAQTAIGAIRGRRVKGNGRRARGRDLGGRRSPLSRISSATGSSTGSQTPRSLRPC